MGFKLKVYGVSTTVQFVTSGGNITLKSLLGFTVPALGKLVIDTGVKYSFDCGAPDNLPNPDTLYYLRLCPLANLASEGVGILEVPQRGGGGSSTYKIYLFNPTEDDLTVGINEEFAFGNAQYFMNNAAVEILPI